MIDMKTLLSVLLLAFLPACASQAQRDEIAAAISAATDPSGPGGTEVTPEEREQIASLSDEIDWIAIFSAIGLSLGAAVPFLRLLPNSLFLGKAQGSALDKLVKNGG